VVGEDRGPDVADDSIELDDLGLKRFACFRSGRSGRGALERRSAGEQPSNDLVEQVVGDLVTVLEQAQILVVAADLGEFERQPGVRRERGDHGAIERVEPSVARVPGHHQDADDAAVAAYRRRQGFADEAGRTIAVAVSRHPG
jgi:hypothetical protein